MKLQQAYISESVKVGTWALIGYKGPGENKTVSGKGQSKNTNFTYDDALSDAIELPATATEAWSATSNINLNDCAAAKNWLVKVSKISGGAEGDAAFVASVENGDDCVALTPSFSSIGK